MKKIERLQKWLADRHHHYGDGVQLFDELASQQVKERHGAFIHSVKECGVFDIHFTQLVNLLARLHMMAQASPADYPAAFEECDGPVYLTDDEKIQTANISNAKIDALTEENIELTTRIEELEYENDIKSDDLTDHSEQIADLQQQIDDNLEEIKTLRNEVNELLKPGVKVISKENMPANIRRAYDRISEMYPVFADLHHDLSDDKLTDDERQDVAVKLCKLDDEHRRLWGVIDAWSEGRNFKLPEIGKKPVLEQEDSVVKGLEMQRQLKRLRDNIASSKKSVARYTDEQNEKGVKRAEARLERYTKELAELEAAIAETYGDGQTE